MKRVRLSGLYFDKLILPQHLNCQSCYLASFHNTVLRAPHQEQPFKDKRECHPTSEEENTRLSKLLLYGQSSCIQHLKYETGLGN